MNFKDVFVVFVLLAGRAAPGMAVTCDQSYSCLKCVQNEDAVCSFIFDYKNNRGRCVITNEYRENANEMMVQTGAGCLSDFENDRVHEKKTPVSGPPGISSTPRPIRETATRQQRNTSVQAPNSGLNDLNRNLSDRLLACHAQNDQLSALRDEICKLKLEFNSTQAELLVCRRDAIESKKYNRQYDELLKAKQEVALKLGDAESKIHFCEETRSKLVENLGRYQTEGSKCQTDLELAKRGKRTCELRESNLTVKYNVEANQRRIAEKEAFDYSKKFTNISSYLSRAEVSLQNKDTELCKANETIFLLTKELQSRIGCNQMNDAEEIQTPSTDASPGDHAVNSVKYCSCEAPMELLYVLSTIGGTVLVVLGIFAIYWALRKFKNWRNWRRVQHLTRATNASMNVRNERVEFGVCNPNASGV